MSDFTDLHVHILPGIDDGAASWEESLAMAQDASIFGTSTLAATPHVDLDAPDVTPGRISELTRELSRRLAEAGIALTVLPGVEMRMSAALNDAARAGDDLSPYTLNRNGTYLLMDLPLSEVPLGAMEACFSLRVHGIQPILAHPERNRELAAKSSLLKGFIAAGVFLQVDAGSLLGHYGRGAKKAALSLVKERRVHAVASDAHTAGRSLDLRQAEEIVIRLCGAKYTRMVFEDNPFCLCMGSSLPQIS